MKTLVILIVAAVAIVASYVYGAVIPGSAAAVVFAVTFVVALKAQNRVEADELVQIEATHKALNAGVVDTLLLVVAKLSGYPDVARKAIEILVDAASYLSGPPSSRLVISADSVVAWKKQGLARVAEAKAIVDEHLKAHPSSGGLGDTFR